MSESKIPLSEEELLQKPFYTVQEEVVEEPGIEIPDGSAAFSSGIRNSNSQHINLLPSLAEAQSENYRELLPKLLLSVRIKNPMEYRNLTVSNFFESFICGIGMYWSKLKINFAVWLQFWAKFNIWAQSCTSNRKVWFR